MSEKDQGWAVGLASEPLETAVYQSVGAASMCWETLSGAGVFDSDRAKFIGDTLFGLIVQRLEAGIRLLSPDDITPAGARQLRAAVMRDAG